MNEGAKTGIFWGIAVAMVAIATFVAWPPSTDTNTESLIGQPLFPEFQDPLTAASMKIVDFDEEQGTLRSFEIAKDRETGVWTIPSHSGYPADATEQMRNAATSLLDVKALNIASENSEDHEVFGVVEPDIEKLRVGDEGVGRLVSFEDAQGDDLAVLIIGKEVRDSENMRYVRIPNQDLVYEINLDVTPLTTKFEDWIEQDLLQLTSLDIQQVDIENYTAAVELNGAVSLDKIYDAQLASDGSDWKLQRLVTYKENTGAERTLAAGEQLNTQKLNELKNALDDLEIVDVGRKPAGMSADLKADKDFLSNRESFQSLVSRGFIPAQTPDGVEILAANGELSVTLKDGVQYLLRFGNVSGLAEKTATADGEEAAGGGANRYLLVTTRVDESVFPAPDLQPIPETIEELDRQQAEATEKATAEPTDAPPTAEPTAEPMKSEETPAAETETPAEPAPAEPAPAEPAPAEPAPAEPAPAAEAAAEEPAPSEEPVTPPAQDEAAEEAGSEPQTVEEVTDEAAAVEADGQTEQSGQGSGSATGGGQQADESVEEPADASTEEPADAAAQAAEPAEGAPQQPAVEEPAPAAGEAAPQAEAAPQDDQPKAEPAKVETEQEKQERLEFEQERIKKENQRKIDERNDQLEQARRRIRELNARFADWYYVVPESTYAKLQLNLDELIQSEADAAAAADDPASGVPQFEGFPGGFPGGFPQGQ